MSGFSFSDVHALLVTSAEVKLQTAADCSEAVMKAAEMIVASFGDGDKLMFCGNGGSVGDSQYLAACEAVRDNGIQICAMTGEGGG